MSKPILLVDDSEDDTNILTDLLRKCSVTNPVQAVRDGRDAIAYLGGEGEYADREKYPFPGIMILDLRMPGVNGFEVLKWIETQPNLGRFLIVVLSGLNVLSDVARAYGLGAHTFLTKPCRADDLRNLIHSFPEHWMDGPRPTLKQSSPKPPKSNGNRP
jgi:CheY-like chemotaxis protein